MNCAECENLLASYRSDELGIESAAACSLHLEDCEACRETLELYACLIGAVSQSPVIIPTETESAALSRSLRGVDLPTPARARLTWRQSLERIALAAMSAVSFIVVTLLTWAVRNGQISVSTIVNPAVLLPGIVIIVFIVSFLPIAITARRKPLNGATFRR